MSSSQRDSLILRYRIDKASGASVGQLIGILESLKEDVSWFCKKFDYRYDQEPWGDAKDAVERSIDFLK